MAMGADARYGRKLNNSTDMVDDGSADGEWSTITSGTRGYSGLEANPNRGMAQNYLNNSSDSSSDSGRGGAYDTQNDSDMGRFANWAAGEGKMYGDRGTFRTRYNKWCETDRLIDETNAKCDDNDANCLRLGHNKFSAGETPSTGRQAAPR